MYCAVIGDIVHSKGISIKERDTVQRKLKHSLEEVNKRFSVHISANFLTTLGDEFQGLLSESAGSLGIVNRIIRDMHPYKIRFGIGVGDMRTTIDPQNAIGADGSAYHFAREAITKLKKCEPEILISKASPLFSVRFETGAVDGELINLCCAFARGIMSKWSEKQWDTVKAVIENDNRQIDAANCLRLAKSTISRNLQAARYAEFLNVLAVLEDYLKNTYDTTATASVRLQQAVNLIDSAGYLMKIQIDYDLALEKYKEALSLRRDVLKDNDERIAESLEYVGEAYLKNNSGRAALECFEEALAIREANGAEKTSIAKSCHNKGEALQMIWKYADALICYNKALSIREKVLGAYHPETEASYEGIAKVYERLGEYDMALEWYNKALAVRETVLGADHPDTAVSYNNIADIYYNLEEYDKALEWYNKALAVRETVLGVDHPDTVNSYDKIAHFYFKLGEYGKALDWYKKVQAVYEKVSGPESSENINACNFIAILYELLRKPKEAKKWIEKERGITKNTKKK